MAKTALLVEKAMRAEQSGLHHEAIACLREAVAVDPNNGQAHLLLGRQMNKIGDFKAAVHEFRAALRLLPAAGYEGSRSPWFGLGCALLELDRYGEAEAAFKSCAASDTSGAVHVLLGATYGRAGREVEARECYQQALKINPRNEEAMFNLAMLLRGEDSDATLRLLREAVQIDPHYAIAFRELGRGCYCHLNDSDEAERWLRRSLELAPTDPWTHHYYAYVMNDLRKYAEAEKHWLRAAELAPSWCEPWCELGVLYQNTRRIAEAELAHRRAVALDPNDLESVHQCGWFLLDIGRPDEARPYLAHALALNPPAEKAQRIRVLLQRAEDLIPDE